DVPLLLGPVVAGFVMTAVVAGRAGVKQLLRRLVLWRVSPRWYLLAFVGMPALYLLGLALVPGAFSSVSLPLSTLLLLPVFFVVLLVTGGPLLEEPGWRGFALPRLQLRWGPLVGTMILGVLWAGWVTRHPLRAIHERSIGDRGCLDRVLVVNTRKSGG